MPMCVSVGVHMRCLLMEIVQLWKAVWTAAGLRGEEVVWVKAAVVWICVYLGKPAIATLPACYLKFLTQLHCDDCFLSSVETFLQNLVMWQIH